MTVLEREAPTDRVRMSTQMRIVKISVALSFCLAVSRWTVQFLPQAHTRQKYKNFLFAAQTSPTTENLFQWWSPKGICGFLSHNCPGAEVLGECGVHRGSENGSHNRWGRVKEKKTVSQHIYLFFLQTKFLVEGCSQTPKNKLHLCNFPKMQLFSELFWGLYC